MVAKDMRKTNPNDNPAQPPNAPRLPKDRSLDAPIRTNSAPTLRPKPTPKVMKPRILPAVERPPSREKA